MSSPVPGLKLCKRYITTHSPSGTSTYAASPDQHYIRGKSRSYATTIPATLADDADIARYKSANDVASYKRPDIVMHDGAVLHVIDLPPGAKSAMHRTASIDYSICCVGTIDHELDGGEVVRLYPGDHIVQRGTMHRWINASTTEPARAVAVTLPVVPVDIPGVGALKQVFLPDSKPKEQMAKAKL